MMKLIKLIILFFIISTFQVLMVSPISTSANEIGNIEKITLEVRESNFGAIEMYRKLNYISAKEAAP